jgi:hypothetical protein
MLRITNITLDSRQRQTVALPDGTSFRMVLYYVPLQYGWFLPEISYQDFIVNGLRVVNSPNLLHQFRNQIPFGLACFTEDKREPMFQEDFNSGFAKLYVLTEAEKEEFTEYLANG